MQESLEEREAARRILSEEDAQRYRTPSDSKNS